MAGIISWHLWKIYCKIRWGDLMDIPTSQAVIHYIKSYTQQWSEASLNKLRLGNPSSLFFEERLLPSSFRSIRPRIRAIKWSLPSLDFKMNIDAAFSPVQAAGGAVIRSRAGDFEVALHFPISASSAMEAELVVAHYSVSWAIEKGYRKFEIEMDSKLVIDAILGDDLEGRWKRVIHDLRRWMVGNHLSFRHVLREINWPAHYLSKLNLADQTTFNDIRCFPNYIRRVIIADKLGLSYFRFG
ncbi:unnamed protein product [Cuscuta epithymum]|uniref:RNase H type-1 domain-containing protein n=1 Tax=Cuscuta epithymum TaxID=186058 RepID=A0AAV0CJV2_9ASTE|nr:unnamed protein product [Cuscuta epithymum]